MIRLHIELDRRINYALQQNDVPVIKAIRLENLTSEPVHHLQVRIAAEPDFCQPWSTHVALLAGDATYDLNAVDLQLSPRFLGSLTERVRGQLVVEAAQQETLLARHVELVDLLARDEWGGLSSLPEVLAAFVLPNHPVIEHVLRSAAQVLEDWTRDPSLNGYQSRDRQRVHVMAAALFGALQQRGLTYVNPPASFEAGGQRVRLPDRILDTGMGTCLDLALLAAGCLEQAGLHALIIVVEGHAFTGVWLEEDCFAEASVADPLRLRKRIELHEIVVFDPTCLTNRPVVGFDHAIAVAKSHLSDPARFLCAIDIRRARKGHIRPLPVSFERGELGSAADEATPHGVDPTVPPELAAPLPSLASAPASAETPATRLDRWQRKLLDLTLRNRLLNFRDTKTALTLLCPDPARLEDMLAEGETFQIHPRPTDMDGPDPRDPNAHRRRTGRDALSDLLREELTAKRLHADATKDDLERRLVELYRAARLGLEEGGASALYLAIGFLGWYETETSERRHLAPILLLPLELHRGSMRQGFTLKLGDEDPRVNVTLLEMLRQDHGLDIPGLDPPPGDENGLDVSGILRAVRQAVRDIDRWEVLDDVRIGIFSFAKFLMWRDLKERAEDLMRSPVVAHLVSSPGQPFDPDGTFPRPERLDETRPPRETYCPLPADSSQLAAVFAAAEGRSFVLEGPPGTGKSQTIANLIAHCLTEGKSVLFVSEKMAALNVVHTRLARIGLARYCLELHSNKAHKREVITQLGESLRRIDDGDASEWAREADRLASLRRELNAYVYALHHRWPNGESVFRATSRLIGLRETPRVPLRWDAPDGLDSEGLDAVRDLVERLATAAGTCGEAKGHAWTGVRREEWTPGWEEELRSAIGALSESLSPLAEESTTTAARLCLDAAPPSLDDLRRIHAVAGVLLMSPSPVPPVALIVESDWEAIRIEIDGWISSGSVRDEIRGRLRKRFHDRITALDLDALQQQLARAQASSWPLSWWRIRRVRNVLADAAKDGKAPAAGDLAAILTNATRFRTEQQVLDRASDRARALLGRYWNDTEADWKEVEAVRDWAQELRSLAAAAAGVDLERFAALRAAWARLAAEGREQIAAGGAIGRQLVAFRQALDTFDEARNRVVDLAALDVSAVWGTSASPGTVALVGTSVRRWQEATGLRDWCTWRRARREAIEQHLEPLVDAYETGAFLSSRLGEVFERSHAEWWLGAVTERDPILHTFSSPEHERKIRQFRSVDDRYMKLTEAFVQARLGERVPESTLGNLPNSEVGILRREVGKRRGHMPVRQLVQRIPTLLPRLKPCLLMSPMSVAQYLDPAYPPFDIVVFDEASQIPVWDAVGAIARGRQAVVVGDPKQLPPTSFFQRHDDDGDTDDDDAVEDLESILDECMGANIPCLQLDWHYRSRHESLITFSNHHYYGNRLLTFPSPALTGMGVSWHHVPDGVYDKGRSRTNRAEADAVVAEVLRRLRDPLSVGLSIGIVTFSLPQQTLIEDLLDAARLADPGIDRHFAEDTAEPVFVKNLENVQGDERDVILFSICYGPDVHGKVSMNFGPMNRDGGERRLNVAVTRARREVVVFSTLRADQIQLARTRARGVRDLKHFLEYAERGPSAFARAVSLDPEADFESPFEEAVHDALVDRGWQVHRQVGSARYRIDLAIVDPDAPGRYLLGVECDGANYHRARTARDRDKLREAVLRDLGWRLHRIWSTDWWIDPVREIEKLEAAIETARQGAVADVPAEPEGTVSSSEAPSTEIPEQGASPNSAPPPPVKHYEVVPIDGRCGTIEEFYETPADGLIRQKIATVVAREGPISLDLAAKRVARFWGFERVRNAVVNRIRSLVPRESVRVHERDDETFLWPLDVEPAEYTGFRGPGPDGSGQRDAGDLPIEEIANAVLHLLDSHMSAPVDEVVREAARLFGFQRVGRQVDERIRKAIARLATGGRARVEGEVVMLAPNGTEVTRGSLQARSQIAERPRGVSRRVAPGGGNRTGGLAGLSGARDRPEREGETAFRGYAVIDFETTGLAPEYHHRVIELAVVHLDASGAVEGAWETMVNPERDLGPTHIHGLKGAVVRQAPPFEQVAPEFIEALTGRVVVAHNASFEARFLREELRRVGVVSPLANDGALCTMRLARRFLPGSGRALADCCAAFDIPLRNAHEAMSDAQATAMLLRAYLDAFGDDEIWRWYHGLPAQQAWPVLPSRGTTWFPRPRTAPAGESFLHSRVDRLPQWEASASESSAELEYVALLDVVLADGFVTSDEAKELRDLAAQRGIRDVVPIHRQYFDQLVHSAWADGELSSAEHGDIVAVGAMLDIEAGAVAAALQGPGLRPEGEISTVTANPAATNLQPGDRVVFTGEMSRPREHFESLARRHGLVPWAAVTKKVRLLVAADLDSLSGKARKARDYGIPIVGEADFEGMLTRSADEDSALSTPGVAME